MSLSNDFGGIDLSGSSIFGVPYDETFVESGASVAYGQTNITNSITFATTGTEIYGTIAGNPGLSLLDFIPHAAGTHDPQICWFSFEGSFNSSLVGKVFGITIALQGIQLRIDGNTGKWVLGTTVGGLHGAVVGVYQKFDVMVVGTAAMLFIDNVYIACVPCDVFSPAYADGFSLWMQCDNIVGMTIVESPSIKNVKLWTGNLGSPE